MQRRVGEHYAEFVIFRGDFGEFRFCLGEDDGTGGGGEQGFRFGRKFDKSAGGVDILRHEGEGFFFAVLAIAESGYGRGIAGVACQVISSEAFQREDCAGIEKLGCAADAGFISGWTSSRG